MWVVVVLVSLLVLIILFLCVPLDVVLDVNTYRSPKFSMRLVWFFGLIDKDLKKVKGKLSGKKHGENDKRKYGDTKSVSAFYRILRTKGLLVQLKRLLLDVLSRLKFRELGADLKIGLDSPADTGLLFAFAMPANLVLGSAFHREVTILPSFEGEATFEGHLRGTTRVWPIQLVGPFIRFIFSPPVIRTAKKLVAVKWKRGR